MNRVWNAPATASGITRAPAGGAACRAAIASAAPAATIWPPPLRLAPTRSSAASAASTVSGSPPSTAAIEVGSSSQALAIARPRTAGQRHGPLGVEHAGEPGGGQLADRVAGDDGAGRAASSSPAASSAAATTSGWVTAVSLISSAVAVVPEPCEVEAGGGAEGVQPGGEVLQLQPRGEHSGFLRSLAGRDDCQHGYLLNHPACRFAGWRVTKS